MNQDVEELGAKVLHQWATLGAFDFVNVVEAPDIETVAKVSVALGARGSTRIQTLPALEIEDSSHAVPLDSCKQPPDSEYKRRPCATLGSTSTPACSSSGRSA